MANLNKLKSCSCRKKERLESGLQDNLEKNNLYS